MRARRRLNDTPLSLRQARMEQLVAEAKVKFVETLAKRPNFGAACKAIGFSRDAVRRWMDEDLAFKAAVDEAWEAKIDDLEEAALSRATSGTKRPIFQNGEHVGDETVHYPVLTIAMLKANRKRYQDKLEVLVSPEQFGQAVARELALEDQAAKAALSGSSGSQADPTKKPREFVAEQ